jgi:putative phosphoribosyl transferase
VSADLGPDFAEPAAAVTDKPAEMTQPFAAVRRLWYFREGLSSKRLCRICYASRMKTVPRVVELTELRDRVRVFRDRTDAGQVLARMLADALAPTALVLAIPAGGVPVAAAIAARLGLPLDLAVVSKVLLPWDTEAGYGAVAFDGTVLLNEPLIEALGLDRATVEAGLVATRQRVARRVETLRAGRPFPDLRSREALLVDDGLASGFTMRVAVEALRHAGARTVRVAVPTGHFEAIERLAPAVEVIYCPNVRGGPRFAVAEAYQHWNDVDEEEVRRELSRICGGPGSAQAARRPERET